MNIKVQNGRAQNVKRRELAQDHVLIVVSCAKEKREGPRGLILGNGFTAADLSPVSQANLNNGRIRFAHLQRINSLPSYAGDLYEGPFFGQFRAAINPLIPSASLMTGKWRLVILSGCYGIVNGLEIVHPYNDGPLDDATAPDWIHQYRLIDILADLVARTSPAAVYGFNYGPSPWIVNRHRQAYRHVFEQSIAQARMQGYPQSCPALSYYVTGSGGFAGTMHLLGRAFGACVAHGLHPLNIANFITPAQQLACQVL